MKSYTRREFLERMTAAVAGAAVLPMAAHGEALAAPQAVHGGAPAVARKGVLEVPSSGYPLVEAAGSHREIGKTIGSAMKERILGHFRYSKEYEESVAFWKGEGEKTIGAMFSESEKAFPHLVEELDGMAESLELPLMHLFAFNCKSEIALTRNPPGCSTIVVKKDDRLILAHNEDGNDLNIGRMFLVRVTPPSGVTFLAFVYPGLLPGNGPALNDRGIVETTNYIQPRRVVAGIPRYFLSRSILEAKDLDEAADLATAGPRAFSFHHNLASLEEGRILSVETAAWPENRHSVKEIDGFYIHTNHFVHDDMTGGGGSDERPYDVPYISSTTRMDVLRRAVERSGAPSDVEGILALLSLHEGRPYSPCRHPEGDVRGVTLGTAVFESPQKRMVLFHGNPCLKIEKTHVVSNDGGVDG